MMSKETKTEQKTAGTETREKNDHFVLGLPQRFTYA